MPKAGEKDTAGCKWQPAPAGTVSGGSTSSVMGVWLFEGESVEWQWTHTPQGSYVSGYTLIKHTDNLNDS